MCKCLETILNLFKQPEEPDPIIIPSEKKEKYALLVGIDKYHPSLNCNLKGCVNGVQDLRKVLINMFGFHPDNIRMLLNEQATYNNVINYLWWLVGHENAELVKGFSGHGSNTPDLNGDQLDGLDEFMVLYDHDWNGRMLIDDVLGDIFDTTPKSSFLSFLTDSCQSASQSKSFFDKLRLRKKTRYLQHPGNYVSNNIKKLGTRAALNHIIFSGCEDHESSIELPIDGRVQGVFTWATLKHIKPDKTWAQIYPDILKTIKDGGFSQTPQLNGRELDTRLIFGGA